MKTSAFPIVTLLICTLLIAFQDTYAQNKITFGGRIGMNLASIKSTYEYDDYHYDGYYSEGVQMAAVQSESSSSTSGWRPGFAFSGFVNIPYNDRISFQPELSFLQRGHQDSESFGSSTFESAMTLNYLEIPLLVRYTIPMEGKISPAFTAGPTLGILLGVSAWEKWEGVKENVDYSDSYSSTSFGFVIGAGLQYALPAGKLMFDIRYDLGLSNLIDDDEFGGYSEKSRAVLFTIGFGF